MRVSVLGFGSLGFRVLGLWFTVEGLGFRVYNNLVNYFDKKLNKSYKTLFKML